MEKEQELEKKAQEMVEKNNTKILETAEQKAQKLVDDAKKLIEEKSKEDIETAVKAATDAVEELEKKCNDAIADVKISMKSAPKNEAPKSFEVQLKDALEEASDDIEKMYRKEKKSFSIELKTVGDMSTGNVTGGSRYGAVMAPGIIYGQNRKVHMDQILPGGSIGPGNTFTFMRESGAGEGSIAAVAETGTKAQLDLDLVEATVNIETIAGYVRFTRKVMNNVPGFISFLQNRLPEKFRKVLDAEIIYGSGSTPHLSGILHSGNYVDSTSTLSDPLIEKLITDIAVLEDTYERDANGILLRPVDYYNFFKNKAEGSGEYDLPMGVTFEGGVLRLFGIPMWASTAIVAPDYIVGDFQNGAQLLTQEAMHIEFFDQDQDNVIKNKITARIEGNYALPIYGSDYFIKGTTATS